MYLFSEINFLPLILLLALWTLGGWLITARIFDLPTRERGLISLAVGLTLGTWFANWLARFMPTTFAFWGAALLTVVIGVALAWPLTRDLFPKEAFQPAQWLTFLAAVFVFTLIGRGLGIFDDYQNLPQLSSMALGDIPPHFAFDPRVLWSYHYFLLVVAAQFERLAGAAPWAALDLARGLTLALALAFGGMLAQRLTGNRIAAALSAAFMFFVGGARWILLLLPTRLLNAASASVTLIGSGADTAPNLTTALSKYWQIQGLGPLPFPFIYGSGLDASLVLSHAGYGASMVMLALLLVLLAGKGRGWAAQAVLAVLLGALALINEVTFVFLYAGLVCAALFWVVKNRSVRLPPSLWSQLPAFVGGGLLALVQGGVFTGVLMGWVGRLTGAPTDALYKVSFAFQLPAVLSAHLGSLSLFNPVDWPVILAETGLVILALPWALKYALELVRDEKWIEAAWLFSIVPSLLTVFVEYTGNAGPTALSRMTAHFLLVLKIYAVPLLWLWAQKRSETAKIALLGWGLAACLSGLALFSLEMAVMPNPVYAESLSALDARMYEKHWGALDPHALVFDPNPIRGTIVLGLHTISSNNYGPPSDPTFVALANDPDPYRLNAAGYRYVYLDLQYGRKYAARFEQACVRSLDKFQETGADGKPSDLRWLVDVGGCR
ncbi:MAG: hypothetical protein WA821_22995 [Anaerolineales bacterium]